MSAKALREKRAPLAAEIKRLADENLAVDAAGNFTEAWTRVNNDYNALSRQIDAYERVEKVTAEQKANELPPGREDYKPSTLSARGRAGRARERERQQAEAIKQAGFDSIDDVRSEALFAWFNCQKGKALTEDMRAACELIEFNPHEKEIAIPLAKTESFQAVQRNFRQFNRDEALRRSGDYRANLDIGQGTKGGYLVPPEDFTRNLEVNLLYYGGMRQVAENLRTTTGERLSWPTVDDTGNPGVQLGENTTIGSSVDPNSFGKIYWDAYKFSSQPVLVPYELIEDSAFNLARVLADLLGIRLGRITNTKFTVGTGAATPMGLVSKLVNIGQDTLSYPAGGGSTGGYAKGYIKSINAAKVISDDILNLQHAVDPAYRRNVGFMCHDQFLLYVRALKDGIGRYLWESNIQNGMPDRLAGDPVTINQDMDSVATTSGKNVLLWGSLDYYKIRTVGELRMYHLVERYRDLDQDAFVGFLREDGNLLYGGNLPIKLLQVT